MQLPRDVGVRPPTIRLEDLDHPAVDLIKDLVLPAPTEDQFVVWLSLPRGRSSGTPPGVGPGRRPPGTPRGVGPGGRPPGTLRGAGPAGRPPGTLRGSSPRGRTPGGASRGGIGWGDARPSRRARRGAHR